MRYSVKLFDRLLEVNDTRAPLVRPTKNPSKRGVIKGISNRSRFRLVKLLSMINRPDPLLFVTLTYRAYGEQWREWKDHFQAWKMLMFYHYPKMCGLWRLEFQERGAPHFHLIIWGAGVTPEAFRAQASDAWLRIIGQQSAANERYGVTVVESDDFRSTGFYLSMYAAKTEKDRRDIQTGREWGVWRKPLLNLEPCVTAMLSDEQERLLRRILRRLHRSNGRSLNNRYYQRLGRENQGFSTFLPYEESRRLVGFVIREAEAIRQHNLRILRIRSGVRLARVHLTAA